VQIRRTAWYDAAGRPTSDNGAPMSRLVIGYAASASGCLPPQNPKFVPPWKGWILNCPPAARICARRCSITSGRIGLGFSSPHAVDDPTLNSTTKRGWCGLTEASWRTMGSMSPPPVQQSTSPSAPAHRLFALMIGTLMPDSRR
jgi:hypothetical protein